MMVRLIAQDLRASPPTRSTEHPHRLRQWRIIGCSSIWRRGPKVLRDEAHHHLARVLRVRVGDEVTLFDGSGREAEARVTRLWPGEILLHVGGVRAVRAPALVGDRPPWAPQGREMDWVVQKATELAWRGFLRSAAPTPSSSSKVSDAMHGARAGRDRRRSRSAVRPHGRPGESRRFLEIAQALGEARGWRVSSRRRARRHACAASPADPPSEITVAVGPEGGFAPAEIVAARAAGVRGVRPGSTDPPCRDGGHHRRRTRRLCARRSRLAKGRKDLAPLRRHPIQSERTLTLEVEIRDG